MDNFWVVTLFHLQPTAKQWSLVESQAIERNSALGIEEFSLTESQVDDILGTRSYSGGDLPLEVLEEVESKVLEKPTNYRFFFSSLGHAQNFHDSIKEEALCESQVEEFEAQDWNAEWKKHYAPIIVNEHLEIIPSWLKDVSSKSAEKIFIYPGMGFGTGSHETTFLCLKLFTENVLSKNIETVLDFGSGSGILGLATLKFFPKAKVDFYDIDPEANKNCYQNAQLNHLDDKSFRLLLPEVRSQLLKNYQLVFANILESILLLEKSNLIHQVAPGGSLILSGILRHQVPAILNSYSQSGMTLVRILEKGDWAALLLVKGLK